jgi:glycosyltransferase involved in cell wall biosynthesis
VSRRLKVLVSAYACSPYKGSEPGVGWGFVAALARRHDLWVLVEEEKFRADIERYLAEHPEFARNVHFHFLYKQRNRWLRKLWPPSYYWYYRRWHAQAYDLARELHAEVGFDVAHQLTMVGFREPGYLWRLGIPFVWGPVGGMGAFPWRYLSRLGVYGALYYLGYNLLNLWQMNISRRPRLAARAAGAGLIAATPENQTGAERYWGCDSTLMSEVGLPQVGLAVTPSVRLPDEPLRIAWSGQHTPGKALGLGLDALAALPSSVRWELHVLGKGPRTTAWQAQARDLGLNDRCYFHGWLEREAALKVMAEAHVMLLTSLRDLTSTVTVEALAMGLPIVCLDHCGFAGVVDGSCGIKVPVTHPVVTIAGLSQALQRLAEDEALRSRLAHGAIQRAHDFAWDKKAEVVDKLYRRVMHESAQVVS